MRSKVSRVKRKKGQTKRVRKTRIKKSRSKKSKDTKTTRKKISLRNRRSLVKRGMRTKRNNRKKKITKRRVLRGGMDAGEGGDVPLEDVGKVDLACTGWVLTPPENVEKSLVVKYVINIYYKSKDNSEKTYTILRRWSELINWKNTLIQLHGQPGPRDSAIPWLPRWQQRITLPALPNDSALTPISRNNLIERVMSVNSLCLNLGGWLTDIQTPLSGILECFENNSEAEILQLFPLTGVFEKIFPEFPPSSFNPLSEVPKKRAPADPAQTTESVSHSEFQKAHANVKEKINKVHDFVTRESFPYLPLGWECEGSDYVGLTSSSLKDGYYRKGLALPVNWKGADSELSELNNAIEENDSFIQILNRKGQHRITSWEAGGLTLIEIYNDALLHQTNLPSIKYMAERIVTEAGQAVA